jgi:hypothetical protein
MLVTTVALSSTQDGSRFSLQNWAPGGFSDETSERKTMVDRIIRTSEALEATTEGDAETLIPALCGCEACVTKQLIAAPSIGICAECGAERSVLTSGTAARRHEDELETWSPYAA